MNDIHVVQKVAQQFNTGLDTYSINLTSIPQTGAVLVATGSTWDSVAGNADMGTGAITDNKGNTWTRLGTRTQASGNQRVWMFYCVVTTPGAGTFTITADPGGAGVLCSQLAISVCELKGVDTADPLAHSALMDVAIAASTTPSSTITTDTYGAFIIGCKSSEGGDPTQAIHGSWSLITDFEDNSAFCDLFTTARPTGQTGTYTVRWTHGSSVACVALAAAFKPATVRTADDLQVFVGSFNPAVTLGNTATVDEIGFTPKAIIFWWSGALHASSTWGQNSTPVANHIRGFGFAKSTTERYCVVTQSLDGATTANSADRMQRNDACIANLSTAGASSGLHDISAIDSTNLGRFVTVVDQAGTPNTVHFMAIGGTNVDVAMGTLTEPAAAGTVDCTPGFQTKAGIIIGSGHTAWNAATTSSGITIGVFDSAGAEAVLANMADGSTANTNMQVRSYCREGEVLASMTQAAPPTLTSRATISAIGATTFTVDFTAVVSGRLYAWLAIGGSVDAAVGSLSFTASSTSVHTESGLSFQPTTAVVLSQRAGLSAAGTLRAPAAGSGEEWSVGAYAGGTNRGGVTFDENAGTADVYSAQLWDSCYGGISNAGAINAAAPINYATSDGFAMKPVTGDASGGTMVYLALAPVAGGVAAELEADVSGAASIAGALTTAITMAASVAGSATLAAALTTAITLAATPAGAATTSADLTTQIRMAAALSGGATVSADLTTAIPLAAAVSGAATFGPSPLDTPILFEANLAGSAATQADLTTAIALAASVAGSASQTSALTTAIAMAAAVAGGATTSADLSTAVELAAAVSGSGATTAALTTEITMASAVSGTGSIAGQLQADGAELEAALTASATTTAALSTQIALAAALSGAGSTTADLTTEIALSAALSGSAAFTGTFEAVAAELEAAVSGAGSVSADLTTAIALQSAVQGGATTTAALSTAIEMAASVSGSATTTAALSTAIRMAAALEGAATLVGAFEGVQSNFEAALSGSATTTADLSTAIALAAALDGSATSTAALTTAIRMAAALTAEGSIVAPLTTAKPLEAAVSGSSSTTAALSTGIALAAAFEAPATVTASLTTAIRFAAALTGTGSVSALLTETARFAVIQVVNESTNRYRVQAEAAACGGVRSEARVRSGMQAEAAACGGVQDESAHHPGITAEDTP